MEIGRPERSHDAQCKLLESSAMHLVFLLSRSIKKRSLPRASTALLPLLPPPPPLWSLATSLSIAQVAAASIAMAVQPSMETQAPGNSSPPKVLPSAWFQFFNFVMIDVCTTMLHAAIFFFLFFFCSYTPTQILGTKGDWQFWDKKQTSSSRALLLSVINRNYICSFEKAGQPV